jgi:hypothetical protein
MRVLIPAILLLFGSVLYVHAQGLAPYSAAVGPGSYHHASTVEEGAQRGMADVIRSSGAANLMNSEAAINVEEARSKYIENRLQATNTYFQMKTINKQYRDAQRRPANPQQTIRLNKERLPDRLTVKKLDPLAGTIKWPIGLTMDEFKADRKNIEVLFAKRAEQGYLNPTQFLEVKQTTASMESELKRQRAKLGGNFTIEARKFLQSLNYEAGFQAG